MNTIMKCPHCGKMFSVKSWDNYIIQSCPSVDFEIDKNKNWLPSNEIYLDSVDSDYECMFCGDYIGECSIFPIHAIYKTFPDYKPLKVTKDFQDKYFVLLSKLMKYNIFSKLTIWDKYCGYCSDEEIIFEGCSDIFNILKKYNIIENYIKDYPKNKLEELINENSKTLELFDQKEADVFLEEMKKIIKKYDLSIIKILTT